MRKGQAAVDYLATYGWALLLLVFVIIVLYSTGVISPERFVSQECVFQPGFSCDNYYLKKADISPYYTFEFTAYNGLGYDLEVEEVSINATDLGAVGEHTFTGSDITVTTAKAGSKIIRAGDSANITLKVTDSAYLPAIGDMKDLVITIKYKNCAVDDTYKPGDDTCDGSEHYLSGIARVRIEP